MGMLRYCGTKRVGREAERERERRKEEEEEEKKTVERKKTTTGQVEQALDTPREAPVLVDSL